MNQSNTKMQRLAVIFVFANLLFNYPLLALFNRATMLGGIPLLYVYMFVAWA